MKAKLKPFITHLLATCLFVGLTYSFLSPVLNDKMFASVDFYQADGMRAELLDLKQEAKVERWVNRNFSGMPAAQLYRVEDSNLAYQILQFFGRSFHFQGHVLFLNLLCAYIAFIAIGFRTELAVIGALAFGFATANVILIDVGHTSKARAAALALPILAGVYAILNDRKRLGFVLLALFLSLQLAANHLQMTYYTALLCLMLVSSWLITERKSLRSSSFSKQIGLMSIAVLLAVLPNVMLFWSTIDYSTESVRGKRLLSHEQKESGKSGLSIDYAGVYSMGIDEALTLFIPGVKGGSDVEFADRNTETYYAFKDIPQLHHRFHGSAAKVPLYWGDQPFSGGPTYFGAFLLLFLVFSLRKSGLRQRLPILLLFLLCLVIALGRNLGFVHELMFELLPLFNKFRTPSMIMNIGGFFLVWLALLGLHDVLSNHENGKLFSQKQLLYSTAALSAALITFILLAPLFYDFSADFGKQIRGYGSDQAFEESLLRVGVNENLVINVASALKADRLSILRSDTLRSMIILLLSSMLVLLYWKQKLSLRIFFVVFAIFVITDLWMVNNRYIHESDFVRIENFSSNLVYTKADQQIRQLAGPHDRVVDLTTSVFQDAKPNFFHNNIGGNHGAKLMRYDDLISRYLNKELELVRKGLSGNPTPALNMLNTRFFKTSTDEKGYLENLTAKGFAWPCDSIIFVASHDEEIEGIRETGSDGTTVVHREFSDYLAGFKPNQGKFSRIELLEYSPGKAVYRSSSDAEQLYVFSEIWYKGDSHWRVTIDKEATSHIRANYLLRALRVPAGEHLIAFEYRPDSYFKGKTYAAIGSGVFLLAILIALATGRRSFKSSGNS